MILRDCVSHTPESKMKIEWLAKHEQRSKSIIIRRLIEEEYEKCKPAKRGK